MKSANSKNIFFWLPLMLLFLGCQLYFLTADPHSKVSTSRGPFTDEGLNTHQVRNFVNLGKWGVAEGDNLIKSPLFNGYLAATLSVFGSHRVAARGSVLILGFLLIYWFGYLVNDFRLSTLFLLIGGFQHHLFQFFHFSMVEPLVIASTLVSIGFGYRYLSQTSPPKVKFLLLALLFSYLAFLFKIQYGYILLLPYSVWVLGFFRLRGMASLLFKQLGLLIVCTVACGLLFYLAWYVPLQDIFETVLAHQGTDRFASFEMWLKVADDSGQYLVWNKLNLFFAVSFLLSLPFGIYLLAKSKHPLKWLLALSGIWVLIESHKLIILYLPSRYALSLFAAMALWMTLVLVAGIGHASRTKKYSLISYLGLAFVLPLCAGHYKTTKLLFEERSTSSQKIIDTYQNIDFKGKTVVGVWATSLVWNKTAHVIPIWKNFLNDANIIEKNNPVVIVTEKDELDSEGVFRSQALNLKGLADSTVQFRYGQYDVNFYFMKY